MSAFAAGAGASALGSAIGGYFGYKANKEQTKAARKAQQESLAYNEMMAGRGAQAITDYLSGSTGATEHGYNVGEQALGAGYDAARQDVTAQNEAAQGQLGAGFAGGLADIYGAGSQARMDLQGGTYGALGSLGGASEAYDQSRSRLAGLLDKGMYSGFEQDPGYQFRQQQGEQAINRAAAARGGRMSGATLQDLAKFNQGLASQEFGNYANRQNALAGLASTEYGQELARLGAQSGLASQAAGLQAQYGQNLANQAMATGQQSAANQQALGLAQSGLSSQTGQQLSGLDVGYGTGMSNLGVGRGTALANLYQNAGMGIANSYTGNIGNAMSAIQGPVQYAGQGTASLGQSIGGAANSLGTLAMMYGLGAFQPSSAQPAEQFSV